MDKQYRHFKFWEQAGGWSIVAGALMIVLPFCLKTHSLFLLAVVLIGVVVFFVGVGLALFFGSVRAAYEWREKFDRCPNCGQGWIRKEK